MTFGHPWCLLLLALPILLLGWEFSGRRSTVTLPMDHGHQKPGRRLKWLMGFAGTVPALLLAMAIVLAAAPLRLAQPKQVRELTNIEFVLDVSGSMSSQFGEGSRYDAAMAAINDFTDRRSGDAFGLTIFGNEVLRWTPLTKDTSAIESAVPFARPGQIPAQLQGTEIGKAVLFCKNKLAERGEGDRLLILVSDGESGDLGGSRARQIGAELAQERTVLYAIHVGDNGPPQDLYDLARPGGGAVFAAADPQALTTVFGHIAHMQPVKMKPAASQNVYWFTPLALVGLGLLALHVTSSFGLRYTPW